MTTMLGELALDLAERGQASVPFRFECPGDRRFSGSTASYCRRARSASYRACSRRCSSCWRTASSSSSTRFNAASVTGMEAGDRASRNASTTASCNRRPPTDWQVPTRPWTRLTKSQT